jgi:hypothetical protein
VSNVLSIQQPQGGALAQSPAATRMAVADVIAHYAMVQEVKQAIMKPKVHFDTIPGTPKPTLLKPGAEALCMAFRVADDYIVEDLSTPDAVRYRVKCVGSHQVAQAKLGEGMGEASSDEEKYRWRKAVCDEEFDETPTNLRRVKYGKDRGGGFYKQKQIRTEPADMRNTVLKMALKRAKVGMTINVTACSDMFSQDLEDMDDAMRDHLARHGDEGGGIDPDNKDKPAEKKPFPDEAFAKHMTAWQKAVNKGKTPTEVLATVEQFNPDLTLSQTQRDTILALKPVGPAAAAASGDAPQVTYAKVDEQMRAARTPDQFDVAATLIAAVADAKQQEELKRTYQELVDAMNEPAPGPNV